MKTRSRPGTRVPGRGAQIMAYRNGQRAGTHGRNPRKDRANTRRRAVQADARA